MRKSHIFFISCMISLISFAYNCNLYANLDESNLTGKTEGINQKKTVVGLEILKFTKNSNLEKAGAKIGDLIVKYNGENVYSIEGLKSLLKSVEISEVEVILKRNDKEITLTIPKGQIGVYTKKSIPKYQAKEDDVVIEGIGILGWGMDMDNSFLGAVYRIDEKFGQNCSYVDISGLSGYAFRLLFFDGWCPSSPDATCGKDVGSEILEKLGYKFDVYHLTTEFMDENMKESAISEEEIRKILMKSIDYGWPIIAIDLIDIPEWGIVTGYQKDGKKFFCRTYFDKTKEYEIARKIPWAIFVITDKQETDITPQYKNSLLFAKELYKTEKFENYFSGLKAIQEWIKDLKGEKYFKEINDTQFEETNLANWWIYYSLFIARQNAKNYLTKNINKFDVDVALITELSEFYAKEVEILKNGFQYVPSTEEVEKRADWNDEMRKSQCEVLENFFEIENEVNNIFNQIK